MNPEKANIVVEPGTSYSEAKGKKAKKRKKNAGPNAAEATSPLQSIHWFRVVLDEAQ